MTTTILVKNRLATACNNKDQFGYIAVQAKDLELLIESYNSLVRSNSVLQNHCHGLVQSALQIQFLLPL